MRKPIRLLAAPAALVVAATLSSPAMADDDKPAGSLYAFAVQGSSCDDPGYIQINAAEGVAWSIGGDPVEVESPASRFEFPDGAQEAVTASPLPGYEFHPDERSTFYLTVFPTCSVPPQCVAPERVQRPSARVARLERKVEAKQARIERLRERVRVLRRR